MNPPLRIELSQPSITAGETIHGVVHVMADVPTAESVAVTLRLDGDNLAPRDAATQEIARGPLRAGASLPFALTHPLSEPFTFDGAHVHGGWYVRATVSLPRALDPEVTAPLTVVAAMIPPDPGLLARVAAEPPAPPSTIAPRWLSALLNALLVLTAVVLFPLLPVAIVLYGRRRLLQTRVEALEVELPRRRFVLGERVTATVRLHLKRPVNLARLTLTLRGTEQWTRGSGKKRRTVQHHFSEQTFTAMEDCLLAPLSPSDGRAEGVYRTARPDGAKGPVLVWECPVQLPHDGLPTAGHAAISWKLRACAELRGFPDATTEVELKTLGARLTAPLATPTPRAIEEASGDIAFVRADGPRPPGIDLDTRERALSRWRWLAAAGGAMLVLALLGVEYIPAHGIASRDVVYALLAVAAAVLLAGCAGFARRLLA
jgi:hypothetical protein